MIERIRAECFQHPVSRALMEQLESEVRRVIEHGVDEALTKELDEYLGFGRYERTGHKKQHVGVPHSSTFSQSK